MGRAASTSGLALRFAFASGPPTPPASRMIPRRMITAAWALWKRSERDAQHRHPNLGLGMHAVLPLVGNRENRTHVDCRHAYPQRPAADVDQRDRRPVGGSASR